MNRLKFMVKGAIILLIGMVAFVVLGVTWLVTGKDNESWKNEVK